MEFRAINLRNVFIEMVEMVWVVIFGKRSYFNRGEGRGGDTYRGAKIFFCENSLTLHSAVKAFM